MSASDDHKLKKEIEERWGELNIGYSTGSGATVFANDLDEVVEPPTPEDSPDLMATTPLQDTLGGVQARLAAEAAVSAEADAELTAPLPPVDATTPLPQVIDLPAEEPAKVVWPVMQQPMSVAATPPPSTEFATSGGKRILPEQMVEEPEAPAPTHRKPVSAGKYYGKIVGAVGAVALLLAFVWWVNPGQEEPKEKPKATPSQSFQSNTPSSPEKDDGKTPGGDVPVVVSDDDTDQPAKPENRPSPTKTATVTEVPRASTPPPSSQPRPSHTQSSGNEPTEEPTQSSSSPSHTSSPEPEPSPPATSAPPATEEPPTEEEPSAPITDEPATSSEPSADSAVTP